MLPARGYGQLARTYLLNLMVFGAWGLIYAILQALDDCREHGQSQRRIERQWLLERFSRAQDEVILLALASIVFSIAIAFIPFIASRIVRGEVGSTMLVMVGTVASATKLAIKSYESREQAPKSTGSSEH